MARIEMSDEPKIEASIALARPLTEAELEWAREAIYEAFQRNLSGVLSAHADDYVLLANAE
jgi:hypothetical protein